MLEQIVHTLLKYHPHSKNELISIKQQCARTAKIPPPPNAAILATYHKLVREGVAQKNKILEKLLRKRDVRTLSGVAIITALTKPYPCPGKCTYCPTEAIMPKSYLSREPAAARALTNKFNPYTQVWTRLHALTANGHPTDKIELIIKGGTWNSYPWRYQKWFIKRCFEACNAFNTMSSKLKTQNSKFRNTLYQIQRANEKSKHRIVGLTIETRPDWVNPKEITRFRELGITRIELGVQTTNEKILAHIKRGHGMKEVADANMLLRNAGFKVDMHLMPQLPGATAESDIHDVHEIFANPAYCPDMIKIYPTAVVPYSALYAEWRMGKYKPYPLDQLIEALIKMKLLVPRYCRITRLIRDIPSDYIYAGNKITNLRETIQRIMRERGLRCQCLRCREAGHESTHGAVIQKLGAPKLFIEKYTCAGGYEYFLSFEDAARRIVFAFCRLRIPEAHNNADLIRFLPEIQGAALIRELHTYGQLVSLHTSEKDAQQHTGFGTKLMQRAECIAATHNFRKLAVISGVGVRGYYRKLGYRLQGTYMIKKLKAHNS